MFTFFLPVANEKKSVSKMSLKVNSIFKTIGIMKGPMIKQPFLEGLCRNTFLASFCSDVTIGTDAAD